MKWIKLDGDVVFGSNETSDFCYSQETYHWFPIALKHELILK